MCKQRDPRRFVQALVISMELESKEGRRKKRQSGRGGAICGPNQAMWNQIFADLQDIQNDLFPRLPPAGIDRQPVTTTTTTTTTSTTTTTTTTTTTKTTPVDQESTRKRKCNENASEETKRGRNNVDLSIIGRLNSELSKNDLQSLWCGECKYMRDHRQELLNQNPYMLETPYEDVNLDAAYGILKSSNSNTYHSQGAFGPSLVPEKCKYPDCDSDSNSIIVGGVPHVVNLPEGLQSWEKSYMSSLLNQDRESGDLDLPIQMYAMQPQRPCSNATGRI